MEYHALWINVSHLDWCISDHVLKEMCIPMKKEIPVGTSLLHHHIQMGSGPCSCPSNSVQVWYHRGTTGLPWAVLSGSGLPWPLAGSVQLHCLILVHCWGSCHWALRVCKLKLCKIRKVKTSRTECAELETLSWGLGTNTDMESKNVSGKQRLRRRHLSNYEDLYWFTGVFWHEWKAFFIKVCNTNKKQQKPLYMLFSSFSFSFFLFHMDPYLISSFLTCLKEASLISLWSKVLLDTLYCSHFGLWIIQSPKAHLACGGTVLPLLLTPMSTLAWCGGPGAAAVTTEPSGHPHRCLAWHQGWRSKNNILSPDVSVQGWDREWDP